MAQNFHDATCDAIADRNRRKSKRSDFVSLDEFRARNGSDGTNEACRKISARVAMLRSMAEKATGKARQMFLDEAESLRI